jgi:RNA polymerase sigma factor (sigma-70 family)
VSRYSGLVYSIALRRLGNAQLAQDVTQSVFLLLARKAGRLSSGTVLSGWLFQTTRFLSADVMKSELRRKQREEHAAMMSRNLESHDGELLENLAPVLDDSVGDLKAAERDAIFLRYFQRKSYHEISLALGPQKKRQGSELNGQLIKCTTPLTKIQPGLLT